MHGSEVLDIEIDEDERRANIEPDSQCSRSVEVPVSGAPSACSRSIAASKDEVDVNVVPSAVASPLRNERCDSPEVEIVTVAAPPCEELSDSSDCERERVGLTTLEMPSAETLVVSTGAELERDCAEAPPTIEANLDPIPQEVSSSRSSDLVVQNASPGVEALRAPADDSFGASCADTPRVSAEASTLVRLGLPTAAPEDGIDALRSRSPRESAPPHASNLSSETLPSHDVSLHRLCAASSHADADASLVLPLGAAATSPAVTSPKSRSLQKPALLSLTPAKCRRELSDDVPVTPSPHVAKQVDTTPADLDDSHERPFPKAQAIDLEAEGPLHQPLPEVAEATLDDLIFLSHALPATIKIDLCEEDEEDVASGTPVRVRRRLRQKSKPPHMLTIVKPKSTKGSPGGFTAKISKSMSKTMLNKGRVLAARISKSKCKSKCSNVTQKPRKKGSLLVKPAVATTRRPRKRPRVSKPSVRVLRPVRAKYDPNASGVFVKPLRQWEEALRSEAETLLHTAFDNNSHECITALLGLLPSTSGFTLRSGRTFGRSEDISAGDKRWLIVQRQEYIVVAAALLRHQVKDCSGIASLNGGFVLEYIASRRSLGGRAKLVVAAVVEICRAAGAKELFSACDLSQLGQAFNGDSVSALYAHERWGFSPIAQTEWDSRELTQYDASSSVQFMVKNIEVPKAA